MIAFPFLAEWRVYAFKKLLSLLRGPKHSSQQTHTSAVKDFRKRYARFRKLLNANAALGELMTDMERKLRGESLFGSLYLRLAVTNALEHARRMVINLQGMRAAHYDGLNDAFDRIAARLHPLLPPVLDCLASSADMPLTLDIGQTHGGMVDTVGGKCTSLGELGSKAQVLIPRGFAVTLRSFSLFMAHNGLGARIADMLRSIEMVDAVTSGVSYSHDPANLLNESIIINAVWGLGPYLVDGIVQPDTWVITRETPHTLIRRTAGKKDRKLALNHKGVPDEQQVPENEQKRLCLSDGEAIEHAAMVMRLEQHYGGYQDIEWAKDKAGRIVFLQSRPLSIYSRIDTPKTPLMTESPLLLEGGDSAYAGIGCGPVVMPSTFEELTAFPEGGVLVAAHSNAAYAQVLDKAEAVIAQTGGVTGHMATVCRELKIPTLLNVPGVMQKLRPEMWITLDTFSCRIYEGRVEGLLPLRRRMDSATLQNTPLRALLRGMMRPDTMLRKPRPISLSGLFSVMGQQVANPQGGDSRFGAKSYAIISDRYLNFSSRVGYHYSVLDAYCSKTMSKNILPSIFRAARRAKRGACAAVRPSPLSWRNSALPYS